MSKKDSVNFIAAIHEPGIMMKHAAAPIIIGMTMALEELLRLFGINQVQLALLFVLSTFLIACCTTSYIVNLSAAIINAFLYDFFVTAPRMGFSFTLGLPITLFIMLIVSVITSATTTKIKEQMSLAIELRQVAEERTQTRMMAEREKTRSNLLRAISHDLRTPLTGILSASSIMAERTKDPLAVDIRTDAEWLIQMVENLLMVTRISDEKSRITKKDEPAEEVMAKAAATVRKRFPNCSIRVKAPDDLIIVPMDAMLMSQVFINLLENAVKHSSTDKAILFELHLEGRCAYFTVSDYGNGLSEELLDNLFGQHPIGNGKPVDSVSGMGLGLSICKTIVNAHNGTIRGENKKEGGALFTVCLTLNIGMDDK